MGCVRRPCPLREERRQWYSCCGFAPSAVISARLLGDDCAISAHVAVGCNPVGEAEVPVGGRCAFSPAGLQASHSQRLWQRTLGFVSPLKICLFVRAGWWLSLGSVSAHAALICVFSKLSWHPSL